MTNTNQPQSQNRILIVDDAPELLETLALFLRSSGHDVTQAADGMDALAVLRRGGPAYVLVTDFNMPRLNGDELILAIKKEQLPVRGIVLMSEGRPVVQDSIFESFLNSEKRVVPVVFLRKAFLTENLDRVIQRMLQPSST